MKVRLHSFVLSRGGGCRDITMIHHILSGCHVLEVHHLVVVDRLGRCLVGQRVSRNQSILDAVP
jgi:hypothetical protein